MTPFDSTAMGIIRNAKTQGRSLVVPEGVVPEGFSIPAKWVS